MNIILCTCDQAGNGLVHVPFPHRIAVSCRPIKVEGEWIEEVHEFIICAHCDHWVDSVYPQCKCKESCHAQVRSRRNS